MKELKKTISYIALTEYHLMISINLALTEFNNDDIENQIYYVKGKKRLSFDINEIPGLKGSIIPIAENNYTDTIKQLSKTSCSRLFFFQENSILFKYLAYHLRKKGAIICLAPDGSKPYGDFNKNHENLSLIKDTINDYRFLFKNKLILPAIIPSRYYRYGSTRIIDEVWVHDIKMFDAKHNMTSGKIIQLPEFTPKVLNSVADAFGFNADLLPKKEEVLFYINQPYWSDDLVDVEMEILRQINTLFPANDIYIKLHPNTQKKTIDAYKKLKNIVLIRDNKPAELFLFSISNSIVFSGWSAALMHYNNSNIYYYLYPLFKKTNDKILSQLTIKPFEHIHVVDAVQQLKFPAN